MTAQEIFQELEKEMKKRVLCEHDAYGAEGLLELVNEKIAELRDQLIGMMPEARRAEGAKALDGDLERLYAFCRQQYDG